MRRRISIAPANGPKYQQIFDQLSRDIFAGKYKPGHRMPSEAALVRHFGMSRITVGRAVRELKERGLVERIAGSGTYVRSEKLEKGGAVFGLLIPDLGSAEIFGAICQGMAAAPEASKHALLWGHAAATQVAKQEQALRLCHEYIERRVSGVFFAPLEHTLETGKTNLAIAKAFEKARIPVVLLDRDMLPFPQRSDHDLVGIHNRRAGYLITEHLLAWGCRRLAFVACPDGAATVAGRIAGFWEAHLARGIPLKSESVQRWGSIEHTQLSRLMKTFRPEGFICANDRTAGDLMHALLKLGYRIPRDVRIAGIDDVSYARLLPVPLTTIHQPAREIGEAAMAAMCARIGRPDLPVREILLNCSLVVRESSGGRKRKVQKMR